MEERNKERKEEERMKFVLSQQTPREREEEIVVEKGEIAG
jgi:hypothetical protein